MIRKIDHSIETEAIQIRHVFQVSYAIEAELLNATDFPPLERTLDSFLESKQTFYGFYEGQTLAAVTEVKFDSDYLHIQSLVVDPKFFRKGIASKLIDYLFSTYQVSLFIVETGAANIPATTLYERHGFKKVKQWMTEIGIEKVAFEKRMP